MNKKGYTLVELIAVFIIIALIATIVIVNFDSSITKTNNKKEQHFKTELEKAACVFIDLQENASYKNTCYSSGTCNVTVEQLINSGILTDDYIDPSTDEKISKNLVVHVTWNSSGIKTCTFTR
jgi:prepilin-type N-terminal cleavage/methylation domain-containing protein